MTTECCGKSRATPFCPQCGKRLGSNDGLGGLLAHCQATARKLKQEGARHLRKARTSSQPDWETQAGEKRLRASDKWIAWADSLAELMASEE